MGMADVVAQLDLMTQQGPAGAPDRPLRPPVTRDVLRRRLGLPHPEPAWRAWAVAGGVGLLALYVRVRNLGYPSTLNFDETYYVKQAYSMLLSGGVELRWTNDPPEGGTKADDLWNAGTYDVFTTEGDPTIVHPPLGKWMIATGMRLLGPEDPAGWRIAGAVAGALSVVLVVLIARRLFDSTLLGGIAGMLLAIDGQHLALSRIGLLDIFLSFLCLAAFALILADRYSTRERLARLMSATGPPGARQRPAGPLVLWRPYLLLAGIALGMACGVKWSGLWFLAAFGLMVVSWDIGARKAAGVRQWFTGGAAKDAPVAFLYLVPVAFAVYVASWAGWFVSDLGYNRFWAQDNPDSVLSRLFPGPLAPVASLAHWHQTMYEFHANLRAEHIYAANAWSWPVQARPTLFSHEGLVRGQGGCGADECKRDILALGNPVLWWAGVIAIVVLVLAWLLRRDWRAGAVVVAFAAGWAPWLLFQDRIHVFTFYSVAFAPYMVLAVTFCLGWLMGPPGARGPRLGWGPIIAWVYLLSVVAVSIWFWPMWVGDVMSTARWESMMWWPSWKQ